MARLISLSNSLSKKIVLLSQVNLSPSELSVLTKLIESANNGCINVSGVMGKRIIGDLGLSKSTFSVCTSRLIKKGLISKKHGQILISPMFSGIEKENDYLFRFEVIG